MKPLDFIVIGAQKGGTTSLFKYLRRHPRIYLPAEKELPFFTRDDLFAEGWASFAARYFPADSRGLLWGKATPTYLHDPRAPGRVADTMPETRLVALLRHPVARAVSHYKMNVRRGRERRPFSEAVGTLLEPEVAQRARTLPASIRHETELYLAWGEYGRQLASYRERFDSDQLLIMFTDELAAEPQAVLDRTLRFLGLQSGFTPPDLGTVYHRGSTRRKLDWLASTWARRIQQRIPGRLGKRIRFWLEIWNIDRRGDREIDIPERLLRHLLAFFEPDVASLEVQLGRQVPWNDLSSFGNGAAGCRRRAASDRA